MATTLTTRWRQIEAHQIGTNAEVSWTVPPECQGQTVEVAYSTYPTAGGIVFRRLTDRSDRSVEYAARRLTSDEEEQGWAPWIREPK
jgi:hypothetical protein